MLSTKFKRIFILNKRTFSYFVFPDMTQTETEFIQSQTELVLQPQCSSQQTLNIFPPQSRKFLEARIRHVQKYYKDFKIPKKDNDRYIRNIVSMPKLERTLASLKWAEVTKSGLDDQPDLILAEPSEIFHRASVARTAEIPLQELPTFYRGNISGKFAISHIKSTSLSLKILGFPNASEDIKRIDFARFDALRFHKMEKEMSKTLIHDVSQPFSSTLETFFKHKPELSTVNLARLIHLCQHLECHDLVDTRTLQKIDPIEAIIQLNALCQALEMDVKPDKIWKFLHKFSIKFPLGLQIQFLKEMGFQGDEIKELILSEGAIKISSKRLPYTSPNYVPLMGRQLALLRKSQPEHTNVLELMALLVRSDFNDVKDLDNGNQENAMKMLE